MADNLDKIDSNEAATEDNSKRRSSRSIKRRKFDDERVQSSLDAIGGSSLSKAQHGRIQSLNMTSTSLDVNSPVKSIPETVNANTSASNHFAGSASTSTVPSSTKRNRPKKQKNLNKYFGRWKPSDDYILIQNVLQTNDLKMVHRGVKFSCRFTLKEVEQRWSTLMYDRTISRLALSAINNLHPECTAKIESKVLFSIDEEELLATIKSNSQPTLDTFQELLTQNLNKFYRRRTGKTLMNHWQLMKQYSLLSDQCSALKNPIPLPLMSALEDRNISILNNEQEVTTITSEHIPTFAEFEELQNDQSILNEEIDPILEGHLSLTNKKLKKEIKVLEDELPTAQVLVYPITGVNPTEYEPQTLAVLRGKFVRYLMRSREITIGRSSKNQQVDVDLKLEGPACKISRRQATIRLRNSGDFLIACDGKNCLYVNGKPLVRGSGSRLVHNSVVEISGLRFIFLINHQLINSIKHETFQKSQMELPVQKKILQQKEDKLKQQSKLEEASQQSQVQFPVKKKISQQKQDKQKQQSKLEEASQQSQVQLPVKRKILQQKQVKQKQQSKLDEASQQNQVQFPVKRKILQQKQDKQKQQSKLEETSQRSQMQFPVQKKILQEQDELDLQLKLLEAENEKHYQQQHNI